MTAQPRQQGRVVGIGLLAFAVLVLLVVLPLLRGGEHPLAPQAAYPLCAAVARALDVQLPALSPFTLEEVPATADHPAVECRVSRAGQGTGAGLLMLVSLHTQALLRRQAGFRGDTRSMAGLFAQESRASGQQVETLAGPWREGWLIHAGNGGMALAEDHGVLVIVNAPGVPAQDLPGFTSDLVPRLRH